MRIKLLLSTLLIILTSSLLAQTVYITKTGEKYHRDGCQYLRNSSKSIHIKEAIESGYEPCKVCKPKHLGSNTSTQTKSVLQKNDAAQRSYSSPRSVQCSGITKQGTRCKRMTTNSSGRCYQH